ncbi:MAG: tyrosine-type recombinase/integrase [Oscillospiraceae bacterium]|nr:tyrosine-type recombinase/integrase [Oscillospiraceae bacterium]
MITSGSIRKRDAKGRSWQITIELPKDPISGKRIRRYKTIEGTKREAERAMAEYIRELEKGYHVTNSKITVSEWIDTWMDVYIEPNVSPTTLSGYQGMIRRYIKPLIGNIQVQELSTLIVQDWVNRLKVSPSSGKPMSVKTIKHTYHVLKGCMDKAVLAGIIPRSPCNRIMMPKGQKKAPVIYNQAQIKQLIAAAKGTEMELVIDMELCLGLRRGELLGLQWDDIDWENKQIHVTRNRVVVGGKSIIKEPKTESGIRTVNVPAPLLQKLHQHKSKCLANRLRMGKNYTVTDFIIVHPDGKPIYPEYLSQMFTKLQNAAGLPKCRFHDLRHLCASIMFLQGVDVKTAQQVLGHKDFTTTMNIYTHVFPSSVKEAADKVGALVFAV